MKQKKRTFKGKASKGAFSGRAAAQKALQVQQRKMIISLARKQALAVFSSHVEEKFLDTTSAALSVDYSGGIGLFTMPSAGTSSSNRVGDEITITKLDFKYNIIVADTTNLVRVVIFKWNNDDGQYSPIVGSIVASGYTAQGFSALFNYNWDNLKAGDFEILYDKCHQLCTNGEQGQVHTVQLWGRGLGSTPKIQLNSGATTGKGRYGLLYISDSAAVSHPSIAYSCRLTFKDA